MKSTLSSVLMVLSMILGLVLTGCNDEENHYHHGDYRSDGSCGCEEWYDSSQDAWVDYYVPPYHDDHSGTTIPPPIQYNEHYWRVETYSSSPGTVSLNGYLVTIYPGNAPIVGPFQGPLTVTVYADGQPQRSITLDANTNHVVTVVNGQTPWIPDYNVR